MFYFFMELLLVISSLINELSNYQVMQELGLIGLRIQRMPSEPDLEFGIPSKYSYMTVQSFFCIIPYCYVPVLKPYWHSH